MQRKTVGIVAVSTMLALVVLATPALAVRLDETAIYIEINDTDGDAGIQVFLDGEQWDTMEVLAPNGTTVMGVAADGGIALQGITELFIESAEPSFDEQPLEEFLALFPAGVYRFRGRTTDGASLRGSARLTHNLPDAPEILSPEEESTVDRANAIIEWAPVSGIRSYEVVLETDEPQLRVFRIDMGRNQTSFQVPPQFLRRAGTYKVEVIAIERSGNRTISEVEFEVE